MAIVAVTGGIGNLGKYISAALLVKPFKDNFSQVKILTRNPSSDVAKELEAAGATIVKVDSPSDVENALKDVNILIDAIGHSLETVSIKDGILEIALKSPNLKYYIPSDFGVDQRQVKIDHPGFLDKVKREEKARSSGKLKVVSIHPGFFLDVGPLPDEAESNIEDGKIDVLGDGNTPISLASKADVGLATASIASSLVQSKITIPDHVRLNGISTTPPATIEIFNRVATDKSKPLVLEKLSLEEFKAKSIATKDQGVKGFFDILKILAAEGFVDHSKVNDNNLINPNLWKFTTLEEYAQLIKGRPGPNSPKDLRPILDQIKSKLFT